MSKWTSPDPTKPAEVTDTNIPLLRTSAARIGIKYSLIYLALSLLTIAGLYVFEANFVSRTNRRLLFSEEQHIRALYRQSGLEAVVEYVNQKSTRRNTGTEFFYRLEDVNGKRLAGELTAWPEGIKDNLGLQMMWTSDQTLKATHQDDPSYWPALPTVFSDGARILICHNNQLGQEIREVVVPALFVGLALTTAATLTVIFALSRDLMQRVIGVNQYLRKFQAGDLSLRLPRDQQHREFDLLARQLNSLFANTERLISGMRRVTSDVAHDLRSPVSRLKTRVELALLQERESTEYRETLSQTLEDLNQLADTFESLIYIGQLESDRAPLRKQTLDVGELVEEMASLYDGEDIPVSLTVDSPPLILGDRHLLQRVVSNLLENALKFSPAGGRIEVEVGRQDGCCRLTVSDRGPGIPEDKRNLVQERFFRLESARSTPGNGLGLSLVKAAVEAHGAELFLEDNCPGLRVVVLFPPVE